MRAELEVAVWTIQGKKQWSQFVEPPFQQMSEALQAVRQATRETSDIPGWHFHH